MCIKPDYNVKSIYNIDLNELENLGIKALLFDLDSTLMASKSGVYTEKTLNFLDSARKKFFIAVVSNNKNEKYIDKVKSISDFPLLFNACKPSTNVINQFLQGYSLTPKDCALIGDRPLTDILCGKKLGCKTILVDSIIADTESKIVRFVRWLERLTISK